MPSLRLGLSTTAIYFAIVALAAVYCFVLTDPPGTTMDMLRSLLPVQLGLVALLIYIIVRHLNWQAIGFGPVRWSAILWLLPSILLMAVMVRDLLPALPTVTFSGAWLLILVPFLIGFTEEVMFRGILLRGAVTRLSPGQAMLLSAVLFALMHVLNGIAIQAVWPTVQHTALAFCVGFFLAPVALKLGNLWPIILWHGIWDLIIFTSQIANVVHPVALFAIMIQAVTCIWLWTDIARQDTI